MARCTSDQFIQSSGNVFADMGLPEAAELDTKARLGVIVTLTIQRQRLTQAEVAATLVIDPRKVSAILHGELENSSVAHLVHFLVVPGQDVEIVVKPKPHSRFARIAVKAA